MSDQFCEYCKFCIPSRMFGEYGYEDFMFKTSNSVLAHKIHFLKVELKALYRQLKHVKKLESLTKDQLIEKLL